MDQCRAVSETLNLGILYLILLGYEANISSITVKSTLRGQRSLKKSKLQNYTFNNEKKLPESFVLARLRLTKFLLHTPLNFSVLLVKFIFST